MVSFSTVFIAAFITFIGCVHCGHLAAVFSVVSPLIKKENIVRILRKKFAVRGILVSLYLNNFHCLLYTLLVDMKKFVKAIRNLFEYSSDLFLS